MIAAAIVITTADVVFIDAVALLHALNMILPTIVTAVVVIATAAVSRAK